VAPASPFAAWDNFYQLVGTSAGALTGLQFVVVALSAQSRAVRRSEATLLAFGSPTIVHFCAVLLLAAVVSAPWGQASSAAAILIVAGAAGVGYTVVVTWRAGRQRDYVPVLEDWLWHTIFPGAAYAGVVAAAVSLWSHPAASPFVLAAAALLLLFSGIHNAWDAAAYIAAMSGRVDLPAREADAPGEGPRAAPPASGPRAGAAPGQGHAGR